MPIQQDKVITSLRDLPPFFRIIFYTMFGILGIVACAWIVTQNLDLENPLFRVAWGLFSVLGIVFWIGCIFALMRKRKATRKGHV